MKIFIKAFAVVFILALGVGGFVFLKNNAPKPSTVVVKPHTTPVTVTTAIARMVEIPIYSRGLVSPGTEIQMATEVGGKVIKVSKNLANGGFFKRGELLLEVDASRYKLEITKATARALAIRQAYDRLVAMQGLDDDEVNGIKQSNKFKNAQVDEALANINAAEADVKIANEQISKARMYAPFDGRVREAFIGEGQLVSPGMQIARVYAEDLAEVRLPLSDHQLSLVDAPVRYQGESVANKGPAVTLQLEFAGQNYFWNGKIVRTEGGVDIRNRMMYVVAQVDAPYERDKQQPTRPPLASGQFVEAQITGKKLDGIIVLPRKVLRNGDEVWIVDDNERLQKRDVGILHKGRDVVYINGGLQEGEQVVLTPLEIAIEGMKVQSTHENDLDVVGSIKRVVSKREPFEDEANVDNPNQLGSQALNQSSNNNKVDSKSTLVKSDLDKVDSASNSGVLADKKVVKSESQIKAQSRTGINLPTTDKAALSADDIAKVAESGKKALEAVLKDSKTKEDVSAILDRIAAKAKLEKESLGVAKSNVDVESDLSSVKSKSDAQVASVSAAGANDNSSQALTKAPEALAPKLLQESSR